MTKRVRVENADTSDYKVIVQVWEKAVGAPPPADQAPDTLVTEIRLDFPTAMTGPDVFITNTRYLVIKEDV